ncbi:MAG: ECF transporter S component [Lachnospiraceae bacterium]|nr:ECF transporter S component [Lachnospiraceae bacterium]
MNDKSVKRIVLAALFAALTCVATMIIRIPVPGTGGYVHPGDALVILCGIFLGSVPGLLAAGIGSALADLLGGYFIYIPITFVVKGLVALLAGLVYQKATESGMSRYLAVVIGGVIDIIIVAVGYFLPECGLYGTAAAAASIIPNIIQGVSGLILAVVLYPVLHKALKGIRSAA